MGLKTIDKMAYYDTTISPAVGGNHKEKENEEEVFSISLWLLPSPDDKESRKLSQMIQTYSERHPDASSVPFEPHVTIVGGVPCPSMKYLQESLVPRLREAMIHNGKKSITSGTSSTSTMTCQFDPQPAYRPKWNQACALVMKQSEEFQQLVHACRQTVGLDDPDAEEQPCTTPQLPEDCFPPPLREPHMSLYYGDPDFVPSKEEVMTALGLDPLPQSPPTTTTTTTPSLYSFEASRVAIWKTDPASAQGVAQWKELAVFDLVPHFNSTMVEQ